MVLLFSYLFFSYERKALNEIFQFFLLSSLFVLELCLLFFFPEIELFMLVGIAGLLSIGVFEASKRFAFFNSYLPVARAFFLTIVLLVSLCLVGFSFFHFEGIYFLVPMIVFLFSVHIRDGNVIAYSFGVFLLFFLYSFVFRSLLSSEAIISTLVFVFFFSFVLIGNTYFWQEKQKYDFAIIHYSSIIFSAFVFLYALLFLEWGDSFMLFLSFGIFLLA